MRLIKSSTVMMKWISLFPSTSHKGIFAMTHTILYFYGTRQFEKTWRLGSKAIALCRNNENPVLYWTILNSMMAAHLRSESLNYTNCVKFYNQTKAVPVGNVTVMKGGWSLISVKWNSSTRIQCMLKVKIAWKSCMTFHLYTAFHLRLL